MFNNVLITINDLFTRRIYCFPAEFSAIDVIFPVNLFGEKFVEDEKDAELYRISHHAYGTGEQLKRKFVLKKRVSIIRINRPRKHLKTLKNLLLIKIVVEQHLVY